MGGVGSGKPADRLCTDEKQALDIRLLDRQGLLRPGVAFECRWEHSGAIASIHLAVGRDSALIRHNATAAEPDHLPLSYVVQIEWCGCRFGGQRPWWRCPGVTCGRRVALLYAGNALACRNCHSLTYRSRREAPDARALRRADAVRCQLGWEPGIASGIGPRPRGMHRYTFEVLVSQYEQYVGKALIYGLVHDLEKK
jgi:hypothetical protein